MSAVFGCETFFNYNTHFKSPYNCALTFKQAFLKSNITLNVGKPVEVVFLALFNNCFFFVPRSIQGNTHEKPLSFYLLGQSKLGLLKEVWVWVYCSCPLEKFSSLVLH